MSVEAMAIALHHSQATGTAKLVLLGIANHDGDGGAWPALATLARYGGCTVRNAQKAIARLETLGEIKRSINAGGNRQTLDHMRPNLYEVTLRCPYTCDGSKNHRDRTKLSFSEALGGAANPLSVATPPVGSDTPPPVGSDTRTIPRTIHRDKQTKSSKRCPRGHAWVPGSEGRYCELGCDLAGARS